MAEPLPAPVAERRLVVMVATATHAADRTRLELLCRMLNVRCRVSSQIGRRSTLLVLELRGTEDAVDKAAKQIDVFVAAQQFLPRARSGWSRAAVAVLSFAVGAGAILLLYWLAVSAAKP